MTQTITSARTSVNQLPVILRLINKTFRVPAAAWIGTDTVLDYGGGKYDQLTETLAEMGVRNLIYDPFNRSEEHNACIRQLVEAKPADLGICSNVLNVIREPAVRREILENLKKWVDPEGGRIYITVYEGDKSSKGRKTRCGWQSNRPARNYLREIRQVFPNSFGTRWGSKALIIIENWAHKIRGWPHIEEN